MKFKAGQTVTVKCLKSTGHEDAITVGNFYKVKIGPVHFSTDYYYFEGSFTDNHGIRRYWAILKDWFDIVPEDDLEPALS